VGTFIASRLLHLMSSILQAHTVPFPSMLGPKQLVKTMISLHLRAKYPEFGGSDGDVSMNENACPGDDVTVGACDVTVVVVVPSNVVVPDDVDAVVVGGFTDASTGSSPLSPK